MVRSTSVMKTRSYIGTSPLQGPNHREPLVQTVAPAKEIRLNLAFESSSSGIGPAHKPSGASIRAGSRILR